MSEKWSLSNGATRIEGSGPGPTVHCTIIHSNIQCIGYIVHSNLQCTPLGYIVHCNLQCTPLGYIVHTNLQFTPLGYIVNCTLRCTALGCIAHHKIQYTTLGPFYLTVYNSRIYCTNQSTMYQAWAGMTFAHLGLGMGNGQTYSQILGLGMGIKSPNSKFCFTTRQN